MVIIHLLLRLLGAGGWIGLFGGLILLMMRRRWGWGLSLLLSWCSCWRSLVVVKGWVVVVHHTVTFVAGLLRDVWVLCGGGGRRVFSGYSGVCWVIVWDGGREWNGDLLLGREEVCGLKGCCVDGCFWDLC